ncbi:MAG: xylose isomerase [Planctomycetes bacterium SM23_32]|nr:MAG: xylose isomerase [Planctomycetes bacterium SM23_32]
MADIPIGLQLFSVRKQCAEDLPGTLEAVAEMGYEGVEFAGYHGHGAEDIRQMLDECGLVACGTHTGLETLLGDELDRTIAFNQTIGNRFLIVPWFQRDTKEGWVEFARTLNEVAARLRPLEMRTGYHNHGHDFRPLNGEAPWDILFGNADPDVIMQLDTGNAFHGGADPVPYIERYPGRATTVHLKEYSATDDKALIGEGDVPWDQVFQLCQTVGGTEWYIVEQESYAYPPLECVARCLENLRKMGV